MPNGKDFTPYAARELQNQDVFMERIQWENRYFLPSQEVFNRIVKSKPLIDLLDPKEDKELDHLQFSRDKPTTQGQTAESLRAELSKAGFSAAAEKLGVCLA